MKQTLKGIRVNMNLSVKEFAKMLDITEDVLYNYENSRTIPDVIFADKIIKITGLKYEDIIFYSNNAI